VQQNHSDEVSVVPFRYKYLSTLLDLLNSNEYLHISTVTMKTLPKIGYLAMMNGHPIAAGFLRRVEGGYAQLDTLTSNKHMGSIIRHKGINAIVDALIQDAKDLRLHGVIAFTRDESILKRAEAIGFHALSDHSLIALRIEE
jgi:hypothetical protein